VCFTCSFLFAMGQLLAGLFLLEELMGLFLKLQRMDNTPKLAVISFFASLYFYNHIGTLYLQTRGLSLLQVNSIWSIIMVAALLAEVPTGVLADKIGRKWSVIIALFIQAAGEFLYLFADSYLVFALIAALAGIGYAFFSGAGEALMYDSLPKDNRETLMKKAMGYIGSWHQTAFFVAPIVGGLIVSQLTISKFLLAILFTAISVSIAFLVSFTLVEPKESYTHPELPPWEILKDGLRLLFTHKQLQWIVAISVFTNSFSNSLLNLYQPYLVQHRVSSSMALGVSLSVGSLLAIVLLRNINKIEKVVGQSRSLIVFSLIPAVFYIFLSFSSSVWTIIPLFIFTLSVADLKNPLLSSYQNIHIPSHNRATVLSLISMLSKIYIAIASLIIGFVADHSVSRAYLMIGLIIIAFSLITRADKYASTSN